ncbi:unnamed protein product [Linum trigynum]|uniref:Uncharacterized protein n=1 Tax=Linum trigynum TaxID=586398 RepID=A0AAV2D1S9_9ROSI
MELRRRRSLRKLWRHISSQGGTEIRITSLTHSSTGAVAIDFFLRLFLRADGRAKPQEYQSPAAGATATDLFRADDPRRGRN